MLSIYENLPPFAKAESPWKQSTPSLLNQHFQFSDCASTTWEKIYPDLCEKIVHRQHNQENNVLQCPAISERDPLYLERCSGAAGAGVGWIKGFEAQRAVQGTTVITWQKSCWSYQKNILLPTKFIPLHFNEELVFLLNYYVTEMTPCGPVHQKTVTKWETTEKQQVSIMLNSLLYLIITNPMIVISPSQKEEKICRHWDKC